MLLTISDCKWIKLYYSYDQMDVIDMFINIFQNKKKFLKDIQIN